MAPMPSQWLQRVPSPQTFSQPNLVDRRYEKLEKPLFEKRANLVSGTDKPADAKASFIYIYVLI